MLKKTWVLVLICVLLCACSAPQTSTTTTTVSQSGASTDTQSASVPSEDDPITIDWVFTKGGYEMPPEPDVILNGILEKTGVWLNRICPPSASYAEQVSVIMASNDLPDVIKFNTLSVMADFAEQGALRPLDDLLDKMPTVVASVPERALETCSIDGQLWAIPVITSEHRYNVYLRQDWLDTVGLDKPETLDEMHDVLYAFTYGDPDGNGEDDTYGFSGAAAATGSSAVFPLESVLGAYGVVGVANGYFYLAEDGTLKPQAVNPAAKEGLKVLNEWFNEGLIDPEFTVLTSAELDEKAYSNTFGAAQGWWVTGPKWQLNMQKVDESVVWTEVGGPTGPNGVGALRGTNLVDFPICVIYDVTQEEADAFAKVTDYIHTEEGMLLTYCGVEGVHWEKKDDGKYYAKEPGFSDAANWIQYHALYQNEWPLLQLENYQIQARRNAVSWDVITNMADGYLTNSEVKYSADLNSLAMTAYSKFVTGEYSLDQFDSFCEEYMANGGQEWADEVTEIYKSRNSQ